ncbi:HPF/RaiA family ribosome-associated protein [bacterium]|nr:HPF/RaiA family ribosome-associated protein [bacterium]
MEVVVTSKGITVNSRDREFIETKIPAALRSVASITKSIKVQAGYEGNYYTLEAQAELSWRNSFVKANASGADLRTTLDTLCDKLNEQARTIKGKMTAKEKDTIRVQEP